MGIRRYILKRITQMIPQILGVTIIVFLLAYLSPGDPVTMFYGMHSGVHYNPAEFDRIRHQLGLDRPLHIQYLDWLWRMVQGDFGYSYILGLPVANLVFKAAANTLLLSMVGLTISICIGIPTGIISSVKQYSKTDNIVTSIVLFLWSMPYFWLSLLLIYTFSVNLRLLPSIGMSTPGGEGGLLDVLAHMVLPASVLGTGGMALIFRLTRSSMLEVLRQDYITTARAKGLKERIVIYKHAFRNAILPVSTVIGLYIGFLIGGSAVVETIFAWPGLGRLMVDSSYNRDYPVIIAISTLSSVIVILAVLITDIAYTYLDPRIKYN